MFTWYYPMMVCCNLTFMHPGCGAGLKIIDFESEYSALQISDEATVTLEGCTLSRNSISDAYANNAVIRVLDEDTILRLRQCTLSGNTAPNMLAVRCNSCAMSDVGIYSDVEREVYLDSDSPSQATTLPLAQAPASRPGIDASTPWLLNVQQVRSRCVLD